MYLAQDNHLLVCQRSLFRLKGPEHLLQKRRGGNKRSILPISLLKERGLHNLQGLVDHERQALFSVFPCQAIKLSIMSKGSFRLLSLSRVRNKVQVIIPSIATRICGVTD